jgi:very-short-patch-repair endonuclease
MQHEADETVRAFDKDLEGFDSPIEARFAGALMIVASDRYRPGLIRRDFELATHDRVQDQCGGLTIWAQAPLLRYRVDFLLRWRVGDDCSCLYAVECDGHDFHSRTRAQVERDKARDNALLALDIPTFRYAGSSIYRDPFGVATDVMEKTGALAARRFLDAEGGRDAARGLIGLQWTRGRQLMRHQ